MKRLLGIVGLMLAFTSPSLAQSVGTPRVPDCVLTGAQLVITAVGTSALFDNRSAGCVDWTLTFTTYGWTSSSVQIVSAPNNTNSPGTPIAFSGASGTTFPVAAGSSGTINASGYQPYMGVAVTARAGTGSFQGTLYGWRTDPIGTLGVTAPVIATSSVAIAISSATATQLVAAVTGKSIYVTGYGISIGTTAATAQTVQFVYGTGSNCATGQVVIWGALSGATEVTLVGDNVPTQVNYGSGVGMGFRTIVSQALCAVTTGTQGVGGGLSFVQMFYMRADTPLALRPWEYSKVGILPKRTFLVE